MAETHALQVGGTLEPGRHVYITRPDDQQAFDLLLAWQNTQQSLTCRTRCIRCCATTEPP